MDIKSIVRAFRYGQLQSVADQDPAAKRPPTIKFLAVALVLGLGLVLLSFWSSPHPVGSSHGATALDVTDPTPSNETSSPPTVSESDAPPAGFNVGDGPSASDR